MPPRLCLRGQVPPAAVPHANVTFHGPFTGLLTTTTGALSASVVGTAIPSLPPPSDSYKYPADGELHGDQPAPFTPSGGIGTNGSAPVYRVQSDFDYQSLALALYQEWIKLDLFHWGLAMFSVDEFEANGLRPQAPKQCTYNYPMSNVPEFLDFNQKLTRWGEAGVYGFLPHLNSGPAAQLLLQSITVEARQQMIFRQFGGQFPMPEWHTPSIPQSWAWTLLAPYISSCPCNQTRLVWQNFLAMRLPGARATRCLPRASLTQLCINATDKLLDCAPAVSQNRSIPLSYPGRKVLLQWDSPGQLVGPNNSYATATNVQEPRFAGWVSQLNVTYSPLLNVSIRDKTAHTLQPDVSTWAGDAAMNGTMFLALTDLDLYVTPYNLALINPQVAALAVYQAG
ncbi:Protein rds1 [Hirsutella rhossiliensis]